MVEVGTRYRTGPNKPWRVVVDILPNGVAHTESATLGNSKGYRSISIREIERYLRMEDARIRKMDALHQARIEELSTILGCRPAWGEILQTALTLKNRAS